MPLLAKDIHLKGISRSSLLLPRAATLLVLLFPSCVLAALFHAFWTDIWKLGPPRGWNASGHYANALIYAKDVFPDTFGWTKAYFFGMPFPNSYPPFFYYCVAILNRLFGVPLDTSFKLVVALPVLSVPSLLAVFSFRFCSDRRTSALLTGLLAAFLLADPRLSGSMNSPSGIDYLSVFLMGQCTQAFGFVFLL